MNATSIAALLLPSLIRLIAALLRAKHRSSAGGRKITRGEWDALLGVFANEVQRRTKVEVG